MNSAVHRAKADESPKNQLIFNSTFASPSVAAHHQRPRYCRCATSIFIASLLQGGGKAYHFSVSFGFQTSVALTSLTPPSAPPHFREFPEQSRRCRHQ